MLRLIGLLLLCLIVQPAIPTQAQNTTLGSEMGTEMGTELDLSLAFLNFSDPDLGKTYSYLPQFGAGLSFTMAPNTRLFLGLGYGHKSGNPYYGIPGFDSESGASLKVLRSRMGLKYNLASSRSLRVYAGFAFLLDWTRESLPPQPGPIGGLDHSPADGLNPGFLFTFAPEWSLGGSGKSLGLEIGYGGTKGELTGDFHSHDIDLTGISGRAYFVFEL